MSDVAADALVDKRKILVEYAKLYSLNGTPGRNLTSLGIILILGVSITHYVIHTWHMK